MTKQEMSKQANKFYIDMQIDEVLPVEKYEIFIKPDFQTASWRFHNDKHQIVIGTKIFNENTIELSEKVKYLESYLHHELAHSIWTEKDLEIISDVLKTEGYAFELFNLFEDARIEENMRQHLKKRFDWLMYEDFTESSNPIEIFFSIIQCEHQKKDLMLIRKAAEPFLVDEFNIVVKFYKKVLSSNSSMDLIKIIKEWYEIFPNTKHDLNSIGQNKYLFYQESKSFNNNEEFDELIKGLDNILVEVSGTSDKQEVRHSKQSIKNENSISSKLLNKTPVSMAFNLRERDMLLAKMEKLFLLSYRNQSTAIPSKRLNVKRLSSGTDKIFKRKEVPTLCKKKITIILDLSGSMNATIENMRLLIDVLDKMATKQIIEANLILTGVDMFKAIYEVLPMPLDKDIIDRIVPKYYGEGLDNTMRENIQLLSSSDFVWILTDGFIDDDSLDKNYFHKYNIKTHAMYIGDTSYKEEMKKSFDYVICEKDVSDLAKVIFGLVKH